MLNMVSDIRFNNKVDISNLCDKNPGNTKEGSITVLLTSCLTVLELAV